MKTIKLLAILLVIIIQSCGPSMEQIEAAREKGLKIMKYKVGQVVYLKPDSTQVIISDYDIVFFNNSDSVGCTYIVRDSRGETYRMEEKFIYGLKH